MVNKTRLLIGASILVAAGVQGQTEFGLKAGVNFPTYSYADSDALSDTKSFVSFYLAGYLDTRIASGLYLHPEVSLQGKGGKLVEADWLGSGTVIQKTIWLDFPVNLLGKVPVGSIGNVFAGAGPYIGFAMNGTNSYTDGGSATAVIIYDDNALKTVDYGVNFLAGFKLGKRASLNANYRLGLANVAGATYKWSDDIKNRVFSLGVGVAL